MFLRHIFSRKDGLKPETQSDEALVHLIRQNGSPEWLGELFNRYAHLVFGVCMKYLKNEEAAKDAVMDIFELLPARISGHEVTSLRGWIWTMAKNHCLMQLRKKKVELHVNGDIEQKTGVVFMENDPFLHLFNDDAPGDPGKKVQEALTHLADPQRICLELVYLKNKSYKEVCRITGFTDKQVKSHVQNGKRNLKNLLEKWERKSMG
ncbi:MAG: sigma-70 family RNA polymerase sigma factor [Bacteroidales bacterium]|nr:sigma-70 family RNA polymerase sigma factor [Bacteroidales bacterium]